MRNREGTFEIYERRKKGVRWNVIAVERSIERANKAAENLVRWSGYPGQVARLKNGETGKWVRNSLVTKETLAKADKEAQS